LKRNKFFIKFLFFSGYATSTLSGHTLKISERLGHYSTHSEHFFTVGC